MKITSPKIKNSIESNILDSIKFIYTLIVWDNNNFRPSYALNYKTPIDYKTRECKKLCVKLPIHGNKDI